MVRGAKISRDRRYRYFLWRVWSRALPSALFIMLNPSTADGEQDDQTIRKCVGFAKRWGCGSIFVVNLFAFRATNPRDLRCRNFDVVGSRNDTAIKNAMKLVNDEWSGGAGPIVVAWGSQPETVLALRPLRVRMMAKEAGVKLKCLGLTKTGQPKHPVMLPYNTKLQRWK